MPGYDGKGPHGKGPMTGAGRGYCILKIPAASDEGLTGFAGLVGYPLDFQPDWMTDESDALRLNLRRIEFALQDLDLRLSALEKVR